MMDSIKKAYDGDIDIKSIIVNAFMFIIYLASIVMIYVEIVYIMIDVLIRHNGLDGRGSFVCQVFLTAKDQLLMWLGNPIKSYLDNLVSDLDFRSDARL